MRASGAGLQRYSGLFNSPRCSITLQILNELHDLSASSPRQRAPAVASTSLQITREERGELQVPLWILLQRGARSFSEF